MGASDTGGALRCLVYISSASGVSRDTVNAILDASRQNNARSGITGILLTNGRNFLQVLEGGESDLLRLAGIIARDPRHSGMVTLFNEAVSARSFADWPMEELRWIDDRDERQRAMADALPNSLPETVRRLILNFSRLN